MPSMLSDAFCSLRSASLPDLSLGSSVLGSKSCVLEVFLKMAWDRPWLGGKMVLEDWLDHRLDPPLQPPPHVIPIPSFDLGTRWGGCAWRKKEYKNYSEP